MHPISVIFFSFQAHKKSVIFPGHAISDLTRADGTESTYTNIRKDSVHTAHRTVYCCYITTATEVQQCVHFVLLCDMSLLTL